MSADAQHERYLANRSDRVRCTVCGDRLPSELIVDGECDDCAEAQP